MEVTKTREAATEEEEGDISGAGGGAVTEQPGESLRPGLHCPHHLWLPGTGLLSGRAGQEGRVRGQRAQGQAGAEGDQVGGGGGGGALLSGWGREGVVQAPGEGWGRVAVLSPAGQVGLVVGEREEGRGGD